MPEKNNELQGITEVLNALNLNEMGKATGFCSRQRLIKPFELIVSLVTAMGEKPVNTLSELHRYFVSLTKTDVQYKPFHNQLSKPAFADLMKQVV